MSGPWIVKCWLKSGLNQGHASGEFEYIADALTFAERWLALGWVGTIKGRKGEEVSLERGKMPLFSNE
jgi:hypothetical protein